MRAMTSTAASPRARVAAGLVHAYTAIGSVLALLMVHLSYRGEVEAVLWLFLAAIFVDGNRRLPGAVLSGSRT